MKVIIGCCNQEEGVVISFPGISRGSNCIIINNLECRGMELPWKKVSWVGKFQREFQELSFGHIHFEMPVVLPNRYKIGTSIEQLSSVAQLSLASLSITNSWCLLKLMSIESEMPSNHLILCHPLLLPHSVFPSIRVFSNESFLHIRWPKLELQLQHQSFQ